MELQDVVEVKTIIDSLKYLETQFPSAIQNWKNQIKTCDGATGILKRLCENPNIVRTEIFGPLYQFLNTYIANREGKVAFTGPTLDTFLKKGLRAIQAYTVVSDFFAKHPEYFIPDVPYTKDPKGYTAAVLEQKKYKDFIFTINERLIGCKDKLNFMFLKLLTTVKNMPQELVDMKNYLENQCLFMRKERLKM